MIFNKGDLNRFIVLQLYIYISFLLELATVV
jgi:hypothetical protein